MNSLDSLISGLRAAQSQEDAHAIAEASARAARNEAAARVLQLGAQLLTLRGSDLPFIYDGNLYTFSGSRVTSVPVESVTLQGGAQS